MHSTKRNAAAEARGVPETDQLGGKVIWENSLTPVQGRSGGAPVDVFRARAEGRAALFAAGELDLHEAVDALQAAAVAIGLINQIGQDRVQATLAEAFGGVR